MSHFTKSFLHYAAFTVHCNSVKPWEGQIKELFEVRMYVGYCVDEFSCHGNHMSYSEVLDTKSQHHARDGIFSPESDGDSILDLKLYRKFIKNS